MGLNVQFIIALTKVLWDCIPSKARSIINFQFVAFLTLDFCPPFLWCDMYVRYRLLLILETLGLAVLLYYIHVVPNAFQFVH